MKKLNINKNTFYRLKVARLFVYNVLHIVVFTKQP